jgi:hypothetical protein
VRIDERCGAYWQRTHARNDEDADRTRELEDLKERRRKARGLGWIPNTYILQKIYLVIQRCPRT